MARLDLDDADVGAAEFEGVAPAVTVQWWWARDLLRNDGWRRARASVDVDIEFWSRSSGDWLSVRAGPETSPRFRLPKGPLEVLVRHISTTRLGDTPVVELEPVSPLALASRMLSKGLARVARGDFRRLAAAAARLADPAAPVTFEDSHQSLAGGSAVNDVPSFGRYAPDPSEWPAVSVIIPTKDQPALLRTCLDGVWTQTDYPLLDIVLVDNGTTDPEALTLLDREAAGGLATVLRRPGPFNFSRLCNEGVTASRGEVVVLLNNDVVPRSPDWLKILVREALRPQVGVAGPLLLYPDDTVQCASVAIGLTGGAGHPWRGMARGDALSYWRTGALRPVSALTGACLVLRRRVFDAVGGFDEELFPVSLNDVDLCLRIGARGLEVVYAPAAQVVHHESRTRRSDHHPAERERRVREQAAFRARWRAKVAQDPWYPPFLTRSDESGRAIPLSGG